MRIVPILLVLAAAQGVWAERQWAPFRAVLETYQAGETQRAIQLLLALGADSVKQSTMGVPAAACERVTVDVRAAAMLHTDTAEAFWHIDRRLSLQHVDLARAWANEADTEFPLFRRRWYLGAG